MVHRLELRTSPHFGAISVEADRRIQRFHRSVRKEGKVVFGQNSVSCGNGIDRIGVATVRRDIARCFCQVSIFFEELSAIRMLDRRRVPISLQPVARLFGCPEPIGDYCHPVSSDERNLKDIMDARNCTGAARVKALDLGSEDRWVRNQRDFHPWKINIKPKFLRAVTLCAAIQPSYLLSSQL